MGTVQLTAEQLRSIAGPKATQKITSGIVDNLDMLKKFGLLQPHRLAHFLAQTGHESDRFHTTSEYASGKAYEGRQDLGNTVKGDGVRFKGHGLIQVTGRTNHHDFTVWCAEKFSNSPDFVANPQVAAEFPWALIGAVWYWQTRNLNRYADQNDIEMVTRRINGGTNGFGDRCTLYTRSALVLLDYDMIEGVVGRFQGDHGLAVDDEPGPRTRAALHEALKQLEAAPAQAAQLPEPVNQTDPPPKSEPAKPAETKPAPAKSGGFCNWLRSLKKGK